MNSGHLEFCASPQWRQLVDEVIVPEALVGVDLGDDGVEIGPGPGLTTDHLRTRTAHLTAVELDPTLAGALADRLAGTNVEVVLGDATALGLADGRFSAAASFHMLHHLPTPGAQDRAFAELARVLAPGGALVAAAGVEDEALRRFHEGDTYTPIDPAGLVARLGRAGFDRIEVRIHDLGWLCTAVAA